KRISAAVLSKIVNRYLGCLTVLKLLNVFNHPVRIKGIRVIEVSDIGLQEGNGVQVFVIGVVRNESDMMATNPFKDGISNGSLARPSSTNYRNRYRTSCHSDLLTPQYKSPPKEFSAGTFVATFGS